MDNSSIRISPVAYFRSPFPSKFGIPRQSGVAEDLEGRIVLTPEFRRAEVLKEIEGFDFLWLIWGFSANAGRPRMTVRPPRLGGNRSVGVFASRSPFRPNGLGLSSVRMDRLDFESPDAPVIVVRGADLMDGTPIYDIKPYVRYSDSHPGARSGYVDDEQWREAEVAFPDALKERLVSLAEGCGGDNAPSVLKALTETLAQRPVPQYQSSPERIYGMPFMGCDVRFRVDGDVVTVTDVVKLH